MISNKIKRPGAQSQCGRVLEVLENNWWTCGTTFQKMFIPTYAQRVTDLKRFGYRILSRPCKDRSHAHAGRVFEYSIQKGTPERVRLFE